MAKKRSKSSSADRGKKKAASRRGGTRSNSPWAKASKKAASKKKSGVSSAGKKKTTRKKTTRRKSDDSTQRLQRVMAAAGIGSRRECETIIEEGRVEVDGQTVVTLGTKVDPTKQKIKVDGNELKQERLQYFILNKPTGVLSTSNDPSGRMRVIDLIMTRNRVYNVGRLDQSSEGLILVTNDGELANRLTHPRYGVEKKYHVQVTGQPDAADLKTLTDGVYLAEGKAKATSAKFIRKGKESSWIEITLMEGRNREIRRLLAKIGHKVRTLKRVSIGPLKMKDLPSGAHRELTPGELKALKKACSGKPVQRKKSIGSRTRGLDEVQEEKQARREARQKKKPSTRKKAKTRKVTGSGARGAARPTKGWRTEKTNRKKRR
ncbi:pseudouridine synthase [Mariniblastus fucicola]|uniref:Pseudouridine synthase n=1 Tax=Mariniblastus fucicola TaxID=980251 RepID=A0A5B9PIA5_9BACT|nr:pseudouridine synthase [Mariniblastus fucicola]QEG24402.1 Ribosomal large subunit pseudouridine synthase B [Mariniblastus fucicola]